MYLALVMPNDFSTKNPILEDKLPANNNKNFRSVKIAQHHHKIRRLSNLASEKSLENTTFA